MQSGGGGRWAGGILPYVGYTGMCGPKGCGFSAVLVMNRVSISAILVINRVWLLPFSLDMGMYVCLFSSLSIRPSTKALHKLCFTLV